MRLDLQSVRHRSYSSGRVVPVKSESSGFLADNKSLLLSTM